MHQIYVDGNGTISGDNGLVNLLQRIVAAGLHYHLFSAPTSPIDETLLLAGLTEVAAAGYTVASVASGAWTTAGVVNHNGSLQAAPVGFGTNSSGSPASCYGYYVTDVGDGTLLYAANFDSAPIVVPNGGLFPTVVPILGDFSQFLS